VGTLADYQSAPYWNEFTNFIEDDLMSVDESEASHIQISVYPNPAKDFVKIEGIEPAEVQVYNAVGQMVKTIQGSNEINVSGLAEGIYLLRITDADGKNRVARVAVKK
jgi:hypothetical protein